MDPITLSLIGAAGQAGAGLIGYLMSLPDKRKAEKIINSALDEYGQLDVPTLEAVVAQEVGPSALEQIKTDPRLKQAQFAALDRLEQMGREGLTFEDRLAQEQALRASARQESAGRARIAQEMAARGTLDSGAQLAMQLANQQASAEGDRQVSLNTAANSQRRMYDAMLQSGRLAGDLRGQDFDEQSRVAQARDAVARYNAGARQQAQAQNIQNAQWTYGQRANLADRKLGAAQTRAGIYGQKAADTQGLFGAFGGAANRAGQLGGDYLQGQQRQQQFQDTLAKVPESERYKYEMANMGYGGGWR